jgi:HK97 family phage portal protein
MIKTESVRIGRNSGLKAILSVPGWLDELEATNRVVGTGQAYELVPLIHRAVRLRCDALSSVPMHIYSKRGGEAVVEWPFATPLRDLIWRTEAGMLLSGGGFWLKKTNRVRTMDVQWLNPFTVGVNWVDGEMRFTQNALATGGNGPWSAGEMVYFREFNPMNDILPGASAAGVAMEDARLLRYITRFASIYFENGAMPVTLLGFEQTPSTEERERVEGWFRKQMTGIANAFKVLALRGRVTPTVITPPLKDLVMNELAGQARHDVAMAFGIPQTMLEDAANYATAGEHRLSFWQDTVRPRGRIYEDVINSQLLGPMGMRIEFDYEEMGVFQVDEANRAGALLNLVNAGIDTQTAMEILGYEVTEEQKRRVMEKQRPSPPAPPPAGGGGNANPQMNADGNMTTNVVTTTGQGKGAADELGQWERWAGKRIGEGKRIERMFETQGLRSTLAAAIQGGLEEASSLAEVRAIFGAARRGEVYP